MGKIIGWFSGGVTSAVACRLAIDKFGVDNCRVIFIDTRNEHDDTYRFLEDCESWYKVKIEKIASKQYSSIQETWFKHLSLNTARGAICSYKLKRVVREQWQKTNEYDHQIFGFEYTKREVNRARALTLNHPKTKPLFPLIENKLSKKDCVKIISDAGVEVPVVYKLGFKNNNCLKTGCVQAGTGYWKKIQTDMPKLFDRMAKVEHDISRLKGKPVTMLRDAKKNLIFLKANPDYPEIKTIETLKGQPVKPIIECNGLCDRRNKLQRLKNKFFNVACLTLVESAKFVLLFLMILSRVFFQIL